MKHKIFWLGHVPILGMVMLLTFFAGLIGNKTATVMDENMEIKDRHCIVIDAGHGGEDGGATSCSGILESNFNLEISLRLEQMFRLLGYPTAMVRRSDTAVHTRGDTIAARKASDLKERVLLANKTENGLLISIHQNYFSESKYSGAQVFYPKTEGSKALAVALQSAFIEKLNPGSNRMAKSASGIYLMDHITCPGVLIECGFLSNPDEEAHLRSPEYQKKICCTIAATVCGYFAS
jgi:N-acetylmuramoyl-L-alanine amidase